MTMRGEITDVDGTGDVAVVTVRVIGSNGRGNHVTATVMVLVPANDGRADGVTS